MQLYFQGEQSGFNEVFPVGTVSKDLVYLSAEAESNNISFPHFPLRNVEVLCFLGLI